MSKLGCIEAKLDLIAFIKKYVVKDQENIVIQDVKIEGGIDKFLYINVGVNLFNEDTGKEE